MFKEFGQHLSDRDVHILDAFTGTGTFIVNLINDEKLMSTDKLAYKYMNEIHCNEIMLLAYYIATINIEHAFHDRMGGKTYQPFPGAVLTDTFQMYEEGDPVDRGMFIQNTVRGLTQISLPIHVLVGNPPWSAKQASANDNNANESYPTLDQRISETYVAKTGATNKNVLYDSYIRAFRWASDRIEKKGIISFVTNGGWLRTDSANGFRRCLVEEFNSIYVLDLRGNQRTKGEESRREGGKIFGSGSRAPVVITMLVKNPDSKEKGVIYYHDIGDYMTRENKLSIIGRSIDRETFEWEKLSQDIYGDWIEKRDNTWYDFIPIGINKHKNPKGIFETWSLGVATARDSWVWNYSKSKLCQNVKSTIDFYEEERVRRKGSNNSIKINEFVRYDETKIKWSDNLLKYCEKNEQIVYSNSCIREGLYRPFCKQWIYYGHDLNARLYQLPKIFSGEFTNICIIVSGSGSFSCSVSDIIPDLNNISGGGQCFPLYWYEETSGGKYKRHDAITDETLAVFRKAYPEGFRNRLVKNGGQEINKEDIFYYIYGILHAPEYRKRFASNLKKELPRIPLSKNFREFSVSGRMLADLHIHYEKVEMYPLEMDGDETNPGSVQKMRWGKRKDKATGKNVDDKSVLIYNANLTFRDIPEDANRYIVNGRSPLEWMIDRYQVKNDKVSGIINDPNEYSEDPCYIIKLIKRLVTVSIRTMEIVDALPPINEMKQTEDWPEMWKMQNDKL